MITLPSHILAVGEARLLSWQLKRDGSTVTPEAATILILDEGDEAVVEASAGISGQTIYYLLNEANIMAVAGRYVVYWTVLLANSEIVKVKHIVTVEEA